MFGDSWGISCCSTGLTEQACTALAHAHAIHTGPVHCVCVYSKDMGSKKELEVRNMEKLRYRKLEKKDLFGIWLFLLAGFLFHLSLGGFFVTQKFQDLFICFTKFAEQ